MTRREGKPNLVYAHICDDVRVEEGGKISLMGLFTSIVSESFPARHPRIAVVAGWQGAAGKFKSAIVVARPGGQKLAGISETEFELRNETQTHRHVAMLINLLFESPGTYLVQVSLDGEVVRSLPLKVEKTVGGKVQ